MGRVFVAGSINMDVVATAERHPKVGETVAGKEVLYFPGGKGANQAVSAAKLGATTALIGRLGNDSFGTELRSFLQVQGVDLSLVADTADAHTGTAIITLANADNTIVVIPGANGLLSPEDVANAPLAKGDVAVSQFEIPLPTIKAFFQEHARPVRSRYSTPRRRAHAMLSCSISSMSSCSMKPSLACLQTLSCARTRTSSTSSMRPRPWEQDMGKSSA